jgi:tetratricopeptide (TPR) repeat protein
MLRYILLLIIIFSTGGSTLASAEKILKDSIVSEGKKRTFYLFVPETLQRSSGAPLVVLLHGSNRNGLSLVEKWTDLAKKEGIVLLGPDSADSSRWSIPGDGPVFLHELIESIKAKYPVSPRRIYLFGHSAGAVMALLLSVYESEYFAATAIHAGVLPPNSNPLLKQAKRKIPIYIQVGTVDPLFPLSDVRATRDAFKEEGFSVSLTEIPGHNHWYYDLAPQINLSAWEFLKSQELPSEPRYEQYNFRADAQRPKAANEQYTLGLERHRAGDLASAIAAYTKAIQLDPKFADAYNNRGAAYSNQQDFAAAIADFSRSIELAPSAASYKNRGSAYLSLKKIDEAIADFSEALKLESSGDTYYYRGAAYEQSGQVQAALSDYDRAIQLDPKFARAYLFRGLTFLRRGDSQTAQKDFDRAFQLDPSLHAEFDAMIKQTRSQSRPN